MIVNVPDLPLVSVGAVPVQVGSPLGVAFGVE